MAGSAPPALDEAFPSLREIEAAHQSLEGRIVRTPVLEFTADPLVAALPKGARVAAKLELFQQAGSFKARGALLNVDALDAAERAAGVTAVSAGNHALATAWAAAREGVSAKVVMMKSADPVRVEGCRAFGAEVVLADDVHAAFDLVERIRSEEGRVFIHPFEGRLTAIGTATCGLEVIRAVPDLDVAIIPIGGGGLIAGMARAIKLVNPDCRVIGVEPVGAASMSRSFDAGAPVTLDAVTTIADSLGAPLALQYSYALARAHVDRIVQIEDRDMLKAMALLYRAMKVAAEPAAAASTAAALGPAAEEVAGRRAGVILCGSTIGAEKFARLQAEGEAALAEDRVRR